MCYPSWLLVNVLCIIELGLIVNVLCIIELGLILCGLNVKVKATLGPFLCSIEMIDYKSIYIY